MSWYRALIALALGAGLPLVSSAQSGISCGTQMSPSVLAFGNYSPLAPGGISMLLGEVVVSCTSTRTSGSNTVGIRATISAGSSGSVAQRRMTSASSPTPMLYNLYQDGSYSTIWPDTSSGSGLNLVVQHGGSALMRLPVFGRVPGNQSGVRPGAYVDSLVLTVRY